MFFCSATTKQEYYPISKANSLNSWNNNMLHDNSVSCHVHWCEHSFEECAVLCSVGVVPVVTHASGLRAASPTFAGFTSRPWQSLQIQARFRKGLMCTPGRMCDCGRALRVGGARFTVNLISHDLIIAGNLFREALTARRESSWSEGTISLTFCVSQADLRRQKANCHASSYQLQFFWQSFLK